MTRRWMTIGMAVLALALVATSGCVRKGPGRGATQPGAYTGDYEGQLMFDEFGNPIDPLTGLPIRADSLELAAGQFEPIYFDYDSPQLKPGEQAKLDQVVAYLQANPTHGVIVEGHCDERGSNEYNLNLGDQRALSVRAALISAGIDGVRVQTRSYGEERPVAFGHDESSWSLNRRAEFVFTQM